MSRTLDAGTASFEAHAAYVEGLGWRDFDPRSFLEARTRAAGHLLGVPRASLFEVFPLDDRA